ncbi:phage major capsid protein [Faecalispora jeddahensis]|uniref:phage major capsid protein n=1 Tax=Faecalispora jeddahensis TaxID=1414721 RepID=UPI0028A8583C|nr:phage major capsid protein [Faecalispora jeddahensis]
MNKKKLLALIAKKNERKAALIKKSEACEDVATLRSINADLDQLNEEIRSLQEMADEMPDDSEPNPNNPAGLDENGQSLRTRAVNGQVPGMVIAGATAPNAPEGRSTYEDKYDTLEYRKAFMEYCVRGTPVPAEYRADTFSGVADAASVIPTTIMNEIIKQMKVRGQIYSRVRKINIQGGVQVPILSLKPTATRITEAAVSDRQKITVNTHISFSYFGLECRVATSLLASIVTLTQFETEIAPLITEAMITKVEIETFNGTGSGEQLGILVDTRVLAEQKITLTPDEFASWESWKKKVFAKVPLAYRNYSIFMGAGTFDGYIDGMVDTTGQPIGRVNYGIADGPAYRFGGKEVIEVEEDIIKGYDTAATGDVVAVFVDLSNYVINSNMQMAMYRWLDHDTNQWVDKAILINDGKLLDAAGVIIVKKGAAAGG